MSSAAARARPRGGPLVMVALLLGAWSGARALLWENPFAPIGIALDLPQAVLVQSQPRSAPLLEAEDAASPTTAGAALALSAAASGWRGGQGVPAGIDPQLAAAHHLLWYLAMREPLASYPGMGGPAAAVAAATGTGITPATATATATANATAPFLPAPPTDMAAIGRWSLDAWAFWRQGSDDAPISQGRVPIYGASQAGGVLQYRLAPGSRRDPRLYLRAYQALVRRGEGELALGASARPLGRVPVRVAGEVRYTDGAFSNALRPAGYRVTELDAEFAPVRLPYGTQLEAYGQAGYVGGPGATAFADGQASVTRELPVLAGLTDNALRLSLGAAAWGGAQKDAHRIDIGPTMRLDLTVGEVPTRLSVDWRERVGGDASPGSGLAATLSTQF